MSKCAVTLGARFNCFGVFVHIDIQDSCRPACFSEFPLKPAGIRAALRTPRGARRLRFTAAARREKKYARAACAPCFQYTLLFWYEIRFKIVTKISRLRKNRGAARTRGSAEANG
jgi:hypothetical protein